MRKFAVFVPTLLAGLLAAGSIGYAQEEAAASMPAQAWNFQVYLDDKSIGSHTFAQYGEANNYEMRIAADLRVKLLFITVYQYEHRNQERWRGGCLQEIESQTDDNGDMFSVVGRQLGEGFEIIANQQTTLLPRCITTFAYWDPRFLTQTSLLNSQTGEYIPVTITGPFPATRIDRGQSVETQRYQIKAKDIDIQLWYSQSGDWLALESAVEGGRTLRYERI